MAQYTLYVEPGVPLNIRDGCRDGEYVIDKELQVAGFDQDLGAGEGEGVYWINIGGAV
jgi:hypothetical protein